MPSELDVAVMYFTGVLVGVLLTLFVQLYIARIRRLAWEKASLVWDARLRG